jgi:hypothetical protein
MIQWQGVLKLGVFGRHAPGGPVGFESAAVLQAWGASAGKIQCLCYGSHTVQRNSFATACWKERRALSWRRSDPRQPFSSPASTPPSPSLPLLVTLSMYF